MFNKFELIGAGVSVFFMALGLYLFQAESLLFSSGPVGAQSAQAIDAQPGIVVVEASDNVEQARTNAFLQAANDQGKLASMVIDDVKFGTGDAVQEGDVVAVHYIGTLQSGQEFDNSHKRGAPFEFKVGGGQVIEGWDKGLVGMKVGGQRILVIPPAMAYGDSGVGPIPGGATLVFSIELMEIK
ncbi:MAG: FKBP-type peptidyl-prolyl cis-trans isomerase [Candidatus Kaiserbacteria bacterium]|nr:FKBP-type peptidyl-prolyl cis-trans isomerase [Candidatus Kaiserbacteria bacterium]MCB9815958.1 FKBP-type peptidyl-prolyl cis-trans isomerase [Candidatus Nomurabacteria bacterium]